MAGEPIGAGLLGPGLSRPAPARPGPGGAGVAEPPVGPAELVAGRFRLEDLLEEHAGARLWRAVDLTLARNVAVHVIPGDDPRAVAVLTAARTSATVSDGRILRVLDALREGDRVSVVHEWSSGLSLDRLMAEEPLDARRAAWLVREVADAIAVAHRHGVAHGRLLPESVMVNDAGAVKLIGFVVDAVLRGRHGGTTSDGAPTDLSEHESDVRNLGALLYAGLTGRWPGTPGSVLPPAPTERESVCRPRQVRSGVPRPLDALCDQLLNVRPGSRPVESAAEVADRLSHFLGEAPVGPGVAVLDEVEPTVLLAPTTDPATDPATDLEATQAWQPPRQPPRQAPSGSARALVPTGDRPPPDSWGPDRDDHPSRSQITLPERSGTRWWRLAAGLGLLTLIVLAAVVALILRTTPDPGPTRSAPGPAGGSNAAAPSKVLTPAAVRDFDPDDTDGTAEENSDLVPLATDGDAATAWRTLTYKGGPQLAPYKRGVGLLLDLGRELRVGEVDVTLLGGSYDLTLLAAPPGTGTPSDITGLTRAATGSGVEGEVPLRPTRAVTTRYLVVWLTALPRSGTGFAGQVAEVVVRS